MNDQQEYLRGSRPVRKRARELRQEQTEPEAVLWEQLRDRRLNGAKFRRQHPIGRFIADLYCPAAKLILEVDGGIHAEQEEYDSARTEWLEAQGYRVLRFTNTEVMEDLSTVLKRISGLIT